MRQLKYLRISVCEQCNTNCWFCFNEGLAIGKTTMTDIDSFEWIVKNIIESYGVDTVRFTGGEPLLNRKLVEMIKVLVGNRVVNTNSHKPSKTCV